MHAPLKIILDTDIGPDCDDAGALSVLHALSSVAEVDILGITHCTSNPYGAGCIDAINHYYGRPNLPVGTLSIKGFLDEPKWQIYNRHITENFPNRFKTGPAPDATKLMRKLLAEQPDYSVVVIGIGPLINLAHLLQSPSDEHSVLDGRDLVAKKVIRLVSMAGRFEVDDSGKQPVEWNVEMDIASARSVCDQWPTPIVFCPFEVGVHVITGKGLMARAGDKNPVKKAYELFMKGTGRSSWDLITVLIAVRGLLKMWRLSENGQVSIDDTGCSLFEPKSKGPHCYVINSASLGEMEEYLENLLISAA